MRVKHTRATSVLTRLAAAALIVAAVGGCSTTDDPERPSGEQVDVIELQVQNIGYEALDLGPSGPSLGDMDVFSGNAIQDGRTVGQGGGSCQTLRVDGDHVLMQCVITMELERGSVTMQSTWTRGASPLDMAITGGTGEYRSARGTVRFWDIATPNERVRAEVIR
ncbi:allene oxide cyclase barrel-like domain-containing protein [Nocardia cyriacigeorgica]|uniref:allene oxide cyclase barrel-like domain-containing protein n=1 Tax=Nocardia cyriacigeorgica TaxID=135487 RepID=UPI0018939482|nr:hypothetical protein [Nocardia cyriacigeorgica]MBF6455973.1 hypothetical protein [Nocardia cyriacigeorgica]MBF6479795.1 hypothetical protein [Nocardia cyriacigeorgica]MBF6553286.1 hypothetical protein [Nocardia cyriacigeorgica]